MLFNSVEFLFFLPIVFIFYWLLKNKLKVQNLIIVLFSYLFYGWWDWKFSILIAITTLCSYYCGILIERFNGKRKMQKWISATNIIFNLLILFYYKYCNFFIDNVNAAFSSIGVDMHLSSLQVILPVGISFYTFQALSYTIDIYNRKMDATKDIVAFFAFLSFFPQLVAGPIERASHLLPQFQSKRKFNYELAVAGGQQMLWGFFKKIVIADNCALFVNNIFENSNQFGSLGLTLGAFLFTIQIYCDFSGYSDIAIGTAKLFGVDLMQNFNFPYFSRDIAEFWRKWHISLTTWFRDYIYIPLGGSRGGKMVSFRNTMVIFLVSGFWHGANWTFIAWGAYHAVLFLPLLLLGKNRANKGSVSAGRIFPSIKELGQMIMTFVLALIGWVLFRAESISQAWSYLNGMFSLQWNLHDIELAKLGVRTSLFYTLFFIIVLFIVEWLNRNNEFGMKIERQLF